MERKFKPFDRVLGRDDVHSEWMPDIFRDYNDDETSCFPYCCFYDKYALCIPYEGNEHLVGTNQAPDGEPELFAFGDHVEVRDWDSQLWAPAVYLCREDFTIPHTDGQRYGYHCIMTNGSATWKQCRKANW